MQTKVGGESGVEGGDDTGGVSSINGVAASFGNKPVPGRAAGKFAKVRPARIRTLRRGENRAILDRVPHKKRIDVGMEAQKNS